MPPLAEVPGYQLLERIGAGAESFIFRAKELATGEIVAIKHLSVDKRENGKYLRHVMNEYRVLHALASHPDGLPEGVVRAYRLIKRGLFKRMKRYSLVMQYVDGYDLRHEHRYPVGQLVEMMRQVSATLGVVHARGFIHGDLKPENMIVSPTGRVTLVDFGFSCPSGSEPMSIRGTRDYMSPEQVDMGPLTEKTDIYNLGATMYFLFGGRHAPALIAQPGDNSHFIGTREWEVPSLRETAPGIPPELDELVLHCLKKRTFERPSCIEEVREALTNVEHKYFG
jgi:eukaryotic-like serine/threonine-protein kinase